MKIWFNRLVFWFNPNGILLILYVVVCRSDCGGTAVRVKFGDVTTTDDVSGASAISQSFPHTYGQPLAHFLRATSNVPDASGIQRFILDLFHFNYSGSNLLEAAIMSCLIMNGSIWFVFMSNLLNKIN
ncbi:hypothetical protein Hdeb2414_s0018g00524441 [Helianthus debilis subsp. tardiflorus]